MCPENNLQIQEAQQKQNSLQQQLSRTNAMDKEILGMPGIPNHGQQPLPRQQECNSPRTEWAKECREAFQASQH
jgi:hypothetical protein